MPEDFLSRGQKLAGRGGGRTTPHSLMGERVKIVKYNDETNSVIPGQASYEDAAPYSSIPVESVFKLAYRFQYRIIVLVEK